PHDGRPDHRDRDLRRHGGTGGAGPLTEWRGGPLRGGGGADGGGGAPHHRRGPGGAPSLPPPGRGRPPPPAPPCAPHPPAPPPPRTGFCGSGATAGPGTRAPT